MTTLITSTKDDIRDEETSEKTRKTSMTCILLDLLHLDSTFYMVAERRLHRYSHHFRRRGKAHQTRIRHLKRRQQHQHQIILSFAMQLQHRCLTPRPPLTYYDTCTPCSNLPSPLRLRHHGWRVQLHAQATSTMST